VEWSICGLWRAVDHEGEALENFVTKTRDKSAALRFIRKALRRHGRAAETVTNGLWTYPAALKELNSGLCRRSVPVGQQPRGKQSSALPTTRSRDAGFPKYAVAPEIRFYSRLGLQPLQLWTPSRLTPNLQASPRNRPGHVAHHCGIRPRVLWDCCAKRKPVEIRPTAPLDKTFAPR